MKPAGSTSARTPASTTARFAPYAQLFASMLDGVLFAVSDGEDRYVLANEAAARVFEARPEELLVPASEFIVRFGLREPTGGPADSLAGRALRGEIVPPVERLIRTPAGVEKVIRASAAPLRDEQGEITGAVVLAADISAPKAEERRVREQAALLQKAHDDRADALAKAEHAAELLEYGDAFLELDASWRILRVNANQERLSGKPRSETVGGVMWEVWPEAANPGRRFWSECHRCMAERVPVQFEDYAKSLDLWLGITAYPARTGGIAIFLRDITQRRRAEQSLRESEARFRTLTEAMPHIVCALAPDGHAEYVNPQWTAFSGLDLASTRKAGWQRVLHPDDVQAAVECRRRVLKTLAPQEVELRYRAADGAYRWFLSRLAPVAVNGRVIRLIGSAMNIEDRKQAEGAVRESEEHLRRYAELVEHAPVLVRNLASEIVVWNQGMERLYGWNRAEALGRVSHDLLRTQYPRPLPEIEARLMAEGRWEGELHHRHRSGADLAIASTWVLHRGADGQPGAIIEIDTDITELKRAQEALRDADRRKNEFLGMLSHELRNPLAPIRNSLYILDRAEPAGQQARRAKEVASRQVAHITRLVDDLLDVTRIARGKIELRRTDLDFAALARRTADDYRALMHDRGLTLGVEVPGDPVLVNGDETRLAQVLGNLLSNAAKFTPAGGQVTLSMSAGEGRAVVHVRDTGPGIEPDVLSSVFEPFTQAKQTLARSEGGLGLGLALVKGLVALHGGEVGVTSGGSGTEFSVAIPLARERGADVGSARTERPGAGASPRLRVLVVDDNHDAADSLAELIELLGHEPLVAYDAFGALALAASALPDVVLCDIGLPGMDGYEFARQFRARSSRAPVRLVALSGYAQPEDVGRAMEAGFDAHVAKPPDPDRLARLLDPQRSLPASA